MDMDAVATAIATRYTAAQVTPPTGYNNIRASTADIPNQLPPLPCVVVFPDSGDFRTGNGTRMGGHDFLVRFYFAQAIDLTRDMNALRKWTTILTDQLKLSTQLGGIVDVATVDGYQMGLLKYVGETYSGVELRIHVVKSEAWAAVA